MSLRTYLMLAPEFTAKMVNQDIIEVFATQVCVASDGFDLINAFLYREERNVEGSSADIQHQDIPLTLSAGVKSIRESSASGLINDA
jgi:hypothetical protein